MVVGGLAIEVKDFREFTKLYTEVRFASFLSSEFITAIVVNSLERKLAKRTSVNCWKCDVEQDLKSEQSLVKYEF